VFRSNAATSLENSLFFDGTDRMNCQQIVLSFPLGDLRATGNSSIKWALTRSDAG
jgi:hypothetical protein